MILDDFPNIFRQNSRVPSSVVRDGQTWRVNSMLLPQSDFFDSKQDFSQGHWKEKSKPSEYDHFQQTNI